MKAATLLTFALAAAPLAASANVITDWDDIAVKTIQPPGPVPPIGVDLSFRASALVEVAMFNAVDCIEPKYKMYGMQVEASPDTSQDAAAATAAATVLMKLVPTNQEESTCELTQIAERKIVAKRTSSHKESRSDLTCTSVIPVHRSLLQTL